MIDFFKRHPFLMRSVYRRGYIALNPTVFPTLHVNEFPKSGGTWLCRMLSECLDWRFDDNAYPLPGKAVIKHHRLNFTPKPTVTVIRDPRDVAVSYYHHCRRPFSGDGFNRNSVALMEERIFSKHDDEAGELHAFVEAMTTDPITPRFTWGDFYRRNDLSTAIVVRYEDMRADTAASLTRVFQELEMDVPQERIKVVAESHNIEKILEKREDTGEAHFIRKGAVGGWRDVLDETSVTRIERDAGALLSAYGYE